MAAILQDLAQPVPVSSCTSCKARWAEIPGKGRGVIANADLLTGELIEISPVAVVPEADLLEPPDRRTQINNYILWWKDNLGEECALGFGYLMLYNHAADPNAEFIRDYGSNTIQVLAKRPVKQGDELTVTYQCPVWFDLA